MTIGTKADAAGGVVAGDKVKICRFDGTEIGSGETDTNGKFTIDATGTNVAPDGATTFKGFVITESGYGNFAEVSVNGETTSITMDADVNSALATIQMLDKVGVTPGFECPDVDDKISDFDPACYMKMMVWQYKAPSVDDGNVGAIGAMARDMGAALFANKGSLGGVSPFDALKAVIKNDFSGVGSNIATLAQEKAPEVSGKAASNYSSYATTLGDVTTIGNNFASAWAGGAGLQVSALQGLTVEDDSNCALCKKNDEYCKNLAKTAIAYDTIADLKEITDDPECVKKIGGVLNTKKKDDGTFDFANFDPSTVAGAAESYKGNCKNMKPGTVGKMFDALPPALGDCGPKAKDMIFMVAEICKDNPDNCNMGSAVGFACGQKEGYIPPPGVDFGTTFAAACPAGTDCSKCANPDAPDCKTLQGNMQQGYCGDGTCQSALGEASYSCAADCGGSTTGGTTTPPPASGGTQTQGMSCMENNNCVTGLKCSGAMPSASPPTPGTCQPL